MNELIKKYTQWKIFNEGSSERTGELYAAGLAKLEAFLDGRAITAASADDLELFGGIWLHKQGVMAPGRRPYIAAVRDFFKWLQANRHIAVNPAVNLAYPKTGRKLPVVMSLANAEKIMWAPDFSTLAGVRDAAILSLLIGCGMRRDGITSLNESDLVQTDFKNEVRFVLNVREKGDKDRSLPVPREADMVLRLYLEHPDLQRIDRNLKNGDKVLFVSLNNMMVPKHEYIGEKRRMAPKAVWEIVRKHGRKAGIEERQLHPHALRHLFGTELMEEDVDQHVRQMLLGHEDPKSTQIYTHLAMRKKMTEADRANPLAKMRTPVGDLLSKLQKPAR